MVTFITYIVSMLLHAGVQPTTVVIVAICIDIIIIGIAAYTIHKENTEYECYNDINDIIRRKQEELKLREQEEIERRNYKPGKDRLYLSSFGLKDGEKIWDVKENAETVEAEKMDV